MGRKPNPPPAILAWEMLDTGIDPRAKDDFTQEPLVQPNAKPPKINNGQAYRDRVNRAKQAAATALVNRLMHPDPPKPFKRRL